MEQNAKNVAVIYSSKHGTTEKVAKQVAQFLSMNATLINLKEIKQPNLASFDCIVIGGSIYAGKVQPKVAEFCTRYMETLLQKKVVLYLCAMNHKEYDIELRNAYPEALRNHAVAASVVGGEFLFEKMNFIERFLVRKISGVNSSISKLDDEKIEALAKAVME